ncbi:MAG: hypothetical protein FWG02_01305 [Holophagaceae bacterium]|nr:hypothetical protein [Holophagaceae bacterium]
MLFAPLLLIAHIALAVPVETAQPNPVAGKWEGMVRVMGVSSAIEVNLVQDGNNGLQGTITAPSQNIIGQKLENIIYSHPDISCQIAGIQGNPTIRGRVEGNTIKGTLSRSGYTFNFELARTGDIVVAIQEKPVTGYWEGAVHVPGMELGIELTIAQENDGKLLGYFTIPAQGIRDKPAQDLVITSAEISFNVNLPPQVSFSGKIEDGNIKGNFIQNQFTFPFDLKRLGDVKPTQKEPENSPDEDAIQEDTSDQPIVVPGYWDGLIRIPGMQIAIQINLIQEENTDIKGYISMPAQGLYNAQLGDITLALPEISFKLLGAPGNPIFKGRIQGNFIRGNFTQGAGAAPFELKRIGEARLLAEPVLPKGLTEREITVGEDPWVLPGTLTLPSGNAPFPVAILVHGSGQNDRDESFGENIGAAKPFRDIAWGLAEKGIAVLRYDKRTLVHAQKMATEKRDGMPVTLNNITIDDAVLAVENATQLAEIDSEKIFVIGHSKGGIALGRIAERASKVAGFVSLAGGGRPLDDILLEQLSRGITGDELEKIQAKMAKVKSLDLKSDTPDNELLGWPATFWLDLRGYDSAISLRQGKRPTLVLQGEADAQVTMEDFEVWKKNYPEATFKSFPKLNHLFMYVEGKSTGEEYFLPGQRVAPEVITTIAEWILK